MIASDLTSLKEQVDSRNYELSVAAATGGASIDASVRQVHLNLRRFKSWLVRSFWAKRAVER